MIRARFLIAIGASLLAVAFVAPAMAQGMPTKLVRVVLPYSAGSGPDAVARQVGETLSHAWGQAVVIDNKPGANGWLAAGEVKRAAADGSTLLLNDNTGVALHPLLYKQMPFNPVQDFDPVAPLYATWFFIVVAADSPFKTVADLIAAAKTKTGGLSYGSSGVGSVPHLGAAMLEAATGTRMVHVPYKEMPKIYSDVSAGLVDWAFGSAATAGPLVRSGRLRYLALAAPKRLAEYADVPTVAEAGGPANFELKAWVGLYAPKGTPAPLLQQMQVNVARALTEPRLREFFKTVGFQPWPGGPADLRQAADDDARRFAGVIKQAHIALD